MVAPLANGQNFTPITQLVPFTNDVVTRQEFDAKESIWKSTPWILIEENEIVLDPVFVTVTYLVADGPTMID